MFGRGVLEGRGGLFLFSKLRKLQNVSKNEKSVIELLYDHISWYTFNFKKISNAYQNINLALQNPPKSPSQTDA
jgi:hypothetical protein